MQERFLGGNISKRDTDRILEQMDRDRVESIRQSRKKVCADDFETLKVIGRGAFGMVRVWEFFFLVLSKREQRENSKLMRARLCVRVRMQVYLVRKKDDGQIFAMKKMKKKQMLKANKIAHVRAERDALVAADNPWVITLHYSFQVRLTHS